MLKATNNNNSKNIKTIINWSKEFDKYKNTEVNKAWIIKKLNVIWTLL